MLAKWFGRFWRFWWWFARQWSWLSGGILVGFLLYLVTLRERVIVLETYVIPDTSIRVTVTQHDTRLTAVEQWQRDHEALPKSEEVREALKLPPHGKPKK